MFCRFFSKEHREGLDSMDINEGSSDEESSMGDFFCGKLFVNFVSVGLRAGMEGFHPVLALRPALHFIFYIFQR